MPDRELVQKAREVWQEQRTEHMFRMMNEAGMTLLEQQELAQRQQELEQWRQEQAQQAQAQQEELARQVTEGMAVDGVEIENPAPPMEARQETRAERKKREQLEKADRKAQEQARRVQDMEAARFENRVSMAGREDMGWRERRAESKLRDEKIEATDRIEEVQLLELEEKASEKERLEIQWAHQAERAGIWGDYARMMPVGSSEREKAMRRKEQEEIKADKLRKRLRVMGLKDENERAREEATLARHARYDMAKEIFREDNPLSHEDATYIKRSTDANLPDTHLVNVGRAFFGGTKPMYIFEDRNAPIIRDGVVAGYEQYLFKEAINCVGFQKPEGALVTEAASMLQEKICGPYSIPAFAAMIDGKVAGSFQKKIESKAGGVDLFAWQGGEQTRERPPLEKKVTDEILREHTLDWLLCNFDTKGENFLTRRSDGNLCSFDKEASFSKLADPEAARMSTEYRPHSNDTIYNVLFREYMSGNQDLDLSTITTQIEKAEQIPDAEYLQMFDKMLTQKYGKAGRARQRAQDAILARKTGLREEYRRFLAELVGKRREALLERKKNQEMMVSQEAMKGRMTLQEAEAALDRLREEFESKDDTSKWIDERGRFRFRGEEITPELLEGRPEDLLVRGITHLELQEHGGTTYNLTILPQQAVRMVEASHGFLTMRQNQDGTATLRPSMPEKITFAGKEIAFRKNYKRFTKMAAMLAVTQGGLNADGRGQVSELEYAVQNCGPGDEINFRESSRIFRTLFFPMLEAEEDLRGGQSAEEAFQEFLDFMKYSRGEANGATVPVFNMEWIPGMGSLMGQYELLGGKNEEIIERLAGLEVPVLLVDEHSIEGGVTKLQGEIHALVGKVKAEKEEARLEAAERRKNGEEAQPREVTVKEEELSKSLRAVWGKIQQYVLDGKEPTMTTREELEKGLEAFREDCHDSVETLRKCAMQDMASEEVFLPGACSATATLVSAARKPVGSPGQEELQDREKMNFEFFARELLAHTPEGELRDRIDRLRGTPVTDEEWEEDKQKIILEYTGYEYHTSGYIGDLDGQQFTLETFAPESYQLTAPGLTDHIGIGIYRGGEAAFKTFYGKDAASILTPEQVRRTQLKLAVTELAQQQGRG